MVVEDRNYYRMLDDEELIALAKSVATTELAVVLAERLRKARTNLERVNSDND